MSSNLPSKRSNRMLTGIAGYLTGPRFPVFMLAATGLYMAFLAVMIWAPVTAGAWGTFVEDFRVWCFGYDRGSGSMRWSAAWVMLTEPLILVIILAVFWRNVLVQWWRDGRSGLGGQLGAAVVAISLAGVGLAVTASPVDPDAVEPFPGERIRTQLTVPEFALINQYSAPMALEDFRGRVVLMTAIYSRCATACPMLVLKAKAAIDELTPEEQAELTVMLVTLDPERDDPEALAASALAYGVDAPQYQFLNGPPSAVNALLDGLQVGRIRDDASGVIDHSNIYFLIDREGKIAYRLSLSDRHQVWLVDALRALISEPARPAGQWAVK
jgi:protein SCO1